MISFLNLSVYPLVSEKELNTYMIPRTSSGNIWQEKKANNYRNFKKNVRPRNGTRTKQINKRIKIIQNPSSGDQNTTLLPLHNETK
jgi:hypothetical protein